MSEIEIYNPQAILAEKQEWSRALAPSGLLPKQYQGNPANLLFAVEYADALGVERIHAITSIHVIEGKPSASADLIAATVRRAGHKLRVVGDDTYAEAHLIRADDPEFTYSARWDMDKARAANLAGKGVWKNYPGAMLRSRAITEVARMGASDALFGVVYTPEELGAEIDASGAPLRSQPIQSAPAPAPDRMRAMLTPTHGAHDRIPEPEPVDVTDAELVESPMLNTSGPLAKRMFATLGDLGITTKAERLLYVSDALGRQIASSTEMTDADAEAVISAATDELLQQGAEHTAADAPEEES